MLRACVLAFLLPAAIVRADDPPKLAICQILDRDAPAPGCHAIQTAATPWGKVTLYTAYDTRSKPLSKSLIQHGEYEAVYSLAFAGSGEPATFEDGGHPTGHPFELCGESSSEWCEKIASSTPRLAVDKRGVVTLVVATITRVQHWVEVDAHTHHIGVDRHARKLTVRCSHGNAGWECATPATD